MCFEFRDNGYLQVMSTCEVSQPWITHICTACSIGQSFPKVAGNEGWITHTYTLAAVRHYEILRSPALTARPPDKDHVVPQHSVSTWSTTLPEEASTFAPWTGFDETGEAEMGTSPARMAADETAGFVIRCTGRRKGGPLVLVHWMALDITQ